jgi:hypothetical protein
VACPDCPRHFQTHRSWRSHHRNKHPSYYAERLPPALHATAASLSLRDLPAVTSKAGWQELRRPKTHPRPQGTLCTRARLQVLAFVLFDKPPPAPSKGSIVECHSQALMDNFKDVFEPRSSPMRIPPVVIPYDLTKPLPRRAPNPSYHFNPDDAALMDADHADNILKGVVETPPEASPFLSPKFVTRHHRHRDRVVYNYKGVNQYLPSLIQPYPSFPHEVGDLAHACYFSKIDLKSGYHQVPLATESRFLTTYCHRGILFQFTRLPMGLSSAPSIFQHLMTSMLQDHAPYSKVYLDDVLIYSSTLEEHMLHVESVLKTCREFNIHLSEKKCEFFRSSATFLGHDISHNSISKGPSYIEPILNMEQPPLLSGLRSFLGQINFIANHLPMMQIHLRPLHDLVSSVYKANPKKKAPIPWSPGDISTFKAVQTYVRDNYHPLAIPDITRPFYIYSDASRTGCGAILLQKSPQGDLYPCAFFSHLWHIPLSYSARDMELFGIHKCLKHWRHFLGHGNHIHLYTDHHSLT